MVYLKIYINPNFEKSRLKNSLYKLTLSEELLILLGAVIIFFAY